MKSLFATIVKVCVLGVVVGACSIAVPAQADGQRYVTIGTGGVTGVYYPTGGAICRLVNRGRKLHGVRCSVESTSGSTANLEAIRDGTLVMGVAQSDVQASALKGEKEFAENGPIANLRALFSVHSELIQIVARSDSDIQTFSDLKGKRVNIGNVGSGHRVTSELIMAHHGWTRDTFSFVGELRSTEQSQALCNGALDAISFTAGIPNASVKEATVTCDAGLVPLEGPWVDAFIAQNPAYAKNTIPAGTYRGTDKAIPTFGPKAVVFADAGAADDVIYHIVKSVFERLDLFRKMHPAFQSLKKEEMVSDGIAAPLHPGALRYYREVGLMR